MELLILIAIIGGAGYGTFRYWDQIRPKVDDVLDWNARRSAARVTEIEAHAKGLPSTVHQHHAPAQGGWYTHGGPAHPSMNGGYAGPRVSKTRTHTNHGFHLLATLCTLGAWAPIWMLVTIWHIVGPRRRTHYS